MITPTQMRAARAMLDVSQGHVSEHLGIAANTLSKIESGQSDVSVSRNQDIQKYYEREGIEFTDNDGVQWNQNQVRKYEGAEGFRNFMDDVYETATLQGGEICLHNAKPDNWLKWLGEEWNNFHTERMLKIKDGVDFKITSGHNDYLMIGKHAEYRWLPEDMWNGQSFYAYGDRIALLNFEDENVNIIVMHNKRFADGFRSLFNVTWKNVATVPVEKG